MPTPVGSRGILRRAPFRGGSRLAARAWGNRPRDHHPVGTVARVGRPGPHPDRGIDRNTKETPVAGHVPDGGPMAHDGAHDPCLGWEGRRRPGVTGDPGGRRTILQREVPTVASARRPRRRCPTGRRPPGNGDSPTGAAEAAPAEHGDPRDSDHPDLTLPSRAVRDVAPIGELSRSTTTSSLSRSRTIHDSRTHPAVSGVWRAQSGDRL